MKHVPVGKTWRPLTGLSTEEAEIVSKRLLSELQSWENTPYMSGQQSKGQACDCVRFITGILDFMFRIERTTPPRLHPDCALNSPKKAWEALHLVLALYPDEFIDIRDEDFIEPGDFIVVGPENGGPGHAMIVGPKPNTLWHCVFPGVHWLGMQLIQKHQRIFRIFRVKDRTKWV